MAQRIKINDRVFKSVKEAINFLNRIELVNSFVQAQVEEINAEYLAKISSNADRISACGFPDMAEEYKRAYTKSFRFFSDELQEEIDKISGSDAMYDALTTLKGTAAANEIVKCYIDGLANQCHVVAAASANHIIRTIIIPLTDKKTAAFFREQLQAANIPLDDDGTISREAHLKEWEAIFDVLLKVQVEKAAKGWQENNFHSRISKYNTIRTTNGEIPLYKLRVGDTILARNGDSVVVDTIVDISTWAPPAYGIYNISFDGKYFANIGGEQTIGGRLVKDLCVGDEIDIVDTNLVSKKVKIKSISKIYSESNYLWEVTLKNGNNILAGSSNDDGYICFDTN